MITAVDKGDSGKLSFENFETAIMRKIMSQDSDGDIMKSFRLFDNDDSGKENKFYIIFFLMAQNNYLEFIFGKNILFYIL